MNRKDTLVLVKNAIANVARGSAAALMAVILPPFLTRLMSPDTYGVWLLVLQLSAFVGYLDLGLQTAIGRFVAHTGEQQDTKHRDRIMSTSMAALTAAAAVGILGIGALTLLLPHIFYRVPHPLLWDARRALILVAGSLAVGLPCSVFNGIFVGLQRYEVPAAIIGGTRVFSGICLILIARHGGNLTQMGAAVAAVNCVAYALQYLMYRIMAPRVRFSTRLISREAGAELIGYCLSLSVWSFAMLLVSGLDVSMVGYFDFDKLAYYAVVVTLITFLTGVQNAVFHVLIPSAAVLQARGDSVPLGQMMVTATRYGAFVLLVTGVPLLFAARHILNLWVGPRYSIEGERILQVLTVANMIRLSAVPYIMTLIGTGQQKLVILTPLLEGVSNLAASIIAGYLFGAIGVAVGTLIGGIIGVLGNFVYNMRRTIEFQFRISDYLRDGLLRPLVCALPLTGAALTFRWLDSSIDVRSSYVLAAVAGLSTAFLLWRWGLVGSERERLRSWYTLSLRRGCLTGQG